MDLRQLEAFVAVMSAGSVTGARRSSCYTAAAALAITVVISKLSCP
jgi:DNA-binding transcriptional LysR family regulator